MAPVPPLRVWISGELTNAAMLNANVRDPVNFYRQPPMFWGRLLTDQSIANNTWTAVTGWSTEVDVDDMYPGSGTKVFIKQSGYYDVRGCVMYATNTNGGRAFNMDRYTAGNAWLGTVVGSGAISSCSNDYPGIANTETTVRLGDLGIYLNASDYVQFWTHQSSGGALNINGNANDNTSYVCLQWVGA